MRCTPVALILVGLLAGLMAIGTGGCATIMSEGGGDDRPLTISSSPDGADVYVRQGGADWQKQGGTTPTTIHLDPGSDADYAVKVELEGYQPSTAYVGTEIDPWFFGSLGLIVLFVVPGLVASGVDLATGAWKKLSRDHLHVDLQPAAG